MTSQIRFPDDFVWGVATAAYQIEGAVDLGGRGESIWDRFVHTEGNVRNGDTGDVACDHYHRWSEDIELMKTLGVGGYRFSIAWPRVIPDGTGRTNSTGLGFYDKLVDGLLEAGIEPFPTLYHWDLPQALDDEGGWLNRETAYAFARYAELVAERLGDRVKNWWTINEPWCVAEVGYFYGEHAPGHQNRDEATTAAHHVLLAHGLGTRAISSAATDAKVGIVINVDAVDPRSQHPSDLAIAELHHDLRNEWYLDSVLLGEYPAAAVEELRWDQAEVWPGDLEVISTPIDHLGINYYSRRVVQDSTVSDADRPGPLIEAALPRTTMGWEVYPEGLHDVLIRYNEAYDLPPVYITESGAAFPDRIINGVVQDEPRRDYLERHFKAAAEAHAAGVPLHGYFVWSLMDNFEWQHGYSQRFGLVWVDYKTQERTIKDSGRWFADLVAQNLA